MRPSLRPFLLAAAGVLLLSGCDLTSDEGPDPVVDPALVDAWETQLIAAVKAERVTPPVAARLYAYAGITLYEGLVHGHSGYRSLAGQLPGLASLPQPARGAVYDWPVVASTAERIVLDSLLAGASAATVEGFAALHREQVEARRSAGVTEAVVARSEAYGVELAQAIVAWCQLDGYAETRGRVYTPPVGDGFWQPTAPAFAPALEPYWGEIRVLAVDAADACDVGDPPAYSADPGSPFYREMQEVYDVSLTRTPEEEAIARFWSDDPGATGTPPGHWIAIAHQLNAQLDLSLIEAAETYAVLGVALNDAFVSVWHTKYRTNYLRPITAIQRLIEPMWVPILNTPPFPEYTSGHSGASGAAATVLTGLHGDGVPFRDDTHAERGLPARSYGSFHEAAEEAAVSRLYGGIHYRQAIEVGVEQGRCVGEAVQARVRTRR